MKMEDMTVHFEKVSKFEDVDILMPVRKTKESAGYDFFAAKDIKIPPYHKQWDSVMAHGFTKDDFDPECPMSLDYLAMLTKETGAKPSLVSTGVKAYLDKGKYLELSVRSSCPLKYWLILANGVGVIDADYADNEDNEGEIFFQIINLSPFEIIIRKGDCIGQGIIKDYYTVDNDNTTTERKGGFGSTDTAVEVK